MDDLRKEFHFAMVPEWVLYHRELSPQAVRLYAVLDRYAEGRCFPSRATLAEQLNVRSTDTVDRALKELTDASAITITRRTSEAGDPTSSLYTVHATPPSGVAARMRPPPRTDAATGGRTDAALTRATTNQNPQPPSGCAIHSSPMPNCRACGTNPRARQQVDDQRARTERRELERERVRAQAAADARAAVSATDPKVKEQLAATRSDIHRVRATNKQKEAS